MTQNACRIFAALCSHHYYNKGEKNEPNERKSGGERKKNMGNAAVKADDMCSQNFEGKKGGTKIENPIREPAPPNGDLRTPGNRLPVQRKAKTKTHF